MNLIDDTTLADLHRTMNIRLDHEDTVRTRRHRIIAATAALTLGLGLTGGALVVARANDHQISYTVDCYGAADLSARHGTSDYVPGATDTPLPLNARIDLAEQQCAAAWRVGTFEPDHATTTRQDYPVPPLTPCQLPDGRLAVFPSTRPADSLCPDLGLGIPSP